MKSCLRLGGPGQAPVVAVDLLAEPPHLALEEFVLWKLGTRVSITLGLVLASRGVPTLEVCRGALSLARLGRLGVNQKEVSVFPGLLAEVPHGFLERHGGSQACLDLALACPVVGQRVMLLDALPGPIHLSVLIDHH